MTYSYHGRVAKALILFDFGDILHSSFISQFHVSLKDLSYYLKLKCILPERLLARMDLDMTCKYCYLCFISAVMNF